MQSSLDETSCTDASICYLLSVGKRQQQKGGERDVKCPLVCFEHSCSPGFRCPMTPFSRFPTVLLLLKTCRYCDNVLCCFYEMIWRVLVSPLIIIQFSFNLPHICSRQCLTLTDIVPVLVTCSRETSVITE